MYLSRVKLNTSIRETIKFLSSPQVSHATVEACFDDSDNTRKLWRLDYYQGHPYVLLLSQQKPNLKNMIQQFGYPEDKGEIWDYQKLLDYLKNGQQYRFRLCANPVYSIKQENGKRGKVVAHITVAQQEDWLRNKSKKSGFHLKQFTVIQRDLKKFKRQHKYVTISIAVYEGILEISNIDDFKQSLILGVGRAKSYGCGLLTLAKL
jgi:CRISPR system Cascade subunit CasE